MSRRAELLAARIEEGAANLAAFVEGVSDVDCGTPTSPTDRRTVAQVVFRFALDVGMVPLTGTTDAGHMWEDLEVFDFRLDPEEVERIECLVSR